MKFRLLILFIFSSFALFAQSDSTAIKKEKAQEPDYQIHLSQPARSIRYMMYEKDFTPIQGKISEDGKSIIIKNYIKGSKVRVKVEYLDGSSEEILRSPCFIDPVV